jgi:hypothetical protein
MNLGQYRRFVMDSENWSAKCEGKSIDIAFQPMPTMFY